MIPLFAGPCRRLHDSVAVYMTQSLLLIARNDADLPRRLPTPPQTAARRMFGPGRRNKGNADRSVTHTKAGNVVDSLDILDIVLTSYVVPQYLRGNSEHWLSLSKSPFHPPQPHVYRPPRRNQWH